MSSVSPDDQARLLAAVKKTTADAEKIRAAADAADRFSVLGVAPVADMMPRMSETALENPVPPVADPVPVLAPIAPTTAPPSDAPTTQPAPEPADPTQVQAWLDAEKTWKWLDAETAWKTRFDKDWKYDRHEFHGDLLAVRIPKQGALLAVSMAGAKYGSDDSGLSAMNQFCNLHLGPESHQRVMDRMMDPDDEAYGDSPMGDLFTELGKRTPE